jgi:Bacterial pre-peptidase C-terminal domain
MSLFRTLIVAIILAAASAAMATQPAIDQVLPPGGQRGTDVELTISGKRLADAEEILWNDADIVVERLSFAAGKLTAPLRISPACRLGEHSFRLRTKTGLSDLRTFWVGSLPNVAEKEPNNSFEQAQKIDLNVTVNGVAAGEDVDYFAFDAKNGQRLVAVIEGLRLGRTMWDPCLAIFDNNHTELVSSDDHPLVRQDCLAAIEVPADGRYFIQVRDSTYSGNDRSNYRLHLGTFPQPTAVVPLGGKPGEDVEFRFLGDVHGEFTRKIRLPDVPASEFLLFPEDEQGTAAAGIPIRVVDLPNVVATQPHESIKDATPLDVPAAANAVIERSGQVDFYRFTAKKGEVIDINIYARRLRSPLDSVIQVFAPGGKSLATNDDAAGPDSYLRFTAPEDGEYSVSVKDQLSRGGATFTYRLELTHVAPSMVVNIPKIQQFAQDRQTIIVPRGNRYAARIGIERRDFGGDCIVSIDDLPAGVTAEQGTIAGNVTSVPVVFEAAADAPLGGTLAILNARHADPKQQIPAECRQVTDLVMGDNQTSYWRCTLPRLSVVVTEEAPFRLGIVEPKVPLVQNGSLALKVVAERNDDFKAPINLELIHSAPGVSNASDVTIPEGQNEAVIPLNANGNAGAGEWKMAVVGKAVIDDGAVWASSQLATLRVAPAYVQFAIDRAAGEQGQAAEIHCKIQHSKPFTGAAKARLVGLPNKVTAPELELANDTAELSFPVAIDAASPVGKHKGIGCQVVITQNEESIVQNVGAAELRIDPPSPKKTTAKSESPPADTAAAPPAKNLSRLEKLRLEAQDKTAEKQAN